MVSESVLFFIFFPLFASGCFYAFQIQNINTGLLTTHILYPHMSHKTHNFLFFKVTWFIMCRPSDPGPFLFYEFNSDESPQMKCWMVVSSYHCAIYFIFLYIGLLPCLQYKAPFLSSIERLTQRGYMLPMYPLSRSNLENFFSYSNKHASSSKLRIPYNISPIVIIVSNW